MNWPLELKICPRCDIQTYMYFEVLIDNSNPMCRTWKVADGLTKTWFYIYLRYCVTFTEIRWWYPYHTHFKLATLVCKIKTYTTYARFKIWHIIMKFVTIKWKKFKIIFFCQDSTGRSRDINLFWHLVKGRYK